MAPLQNNSQTKEEKLQFNRRPIFSTSNPFGNAKQKGK